MRFISILLLLFVYVSISNGKEFQRTIEFVNSRPTEPDEKRCTMIKVSNQRLYITEFIPHANRRHAHHMVLIGCKHKAKITTMDEYGNSWRCDAKGDDSCGAVGGDKLFFTWALNAQGFTFPEDVGFRIGEDAGVNYLVLQIHYAKRIDEGDDSGLTITLNSDNLPYQAAMYILGAAGYVPPHLNEFHLETACKLNLPYRIVPLAYRVHSHHLGDVTSAYVIRHNHWTELGRMSPRQPEQYYMATNQHLVLDNDDVLAARCTMNSLARDEPTHMGHRNIDEMCVFYLLYFTDYEDNIGDSTCFKNTQMYNWKKDLKKLNVHTDPPQDASSLKGVKLIKPLAELEREELAHLEYSETFFF